LRVELRFFDPPLLVFELLRFFDPLERFLLLLVFVRPSEARSLFTVAAAICFARFVDRPFFFALSLMCSYCRSSLLLHALGILTSSCTILCAKAALGRNVARRKPKAQTDRGVLIGHVAVLIANRERRLGPRTQRGRYVRR